MTPQLALALILAIAALAKRKAPLPAPIVSYISHNEPLYLPLVFGG